MRVVIEPGHDGVYDPGAVVEGVREADVVREVARRQWQATCCEPAAT